MYYKKIINQISLSQSNIKEKSNMLSYTTERLVTIYRIEIINRRYKPTLKCFPSPHRQYGATQHRNHKLPIQSLNDLLIIFVIVIFCKWWVLAQKKHKSAPWDQDS